MFCLVVQLYLIEILHQTTTSTCSIFDAKKLYLIEILHQTTTPLTALLVSRVLYLIEILHQTTTMANIRSKPVRLYLIEILHQTTTADSTQDRSFRCILSKFYIKPQREREYRRVDVVVSYRNSTSNHNCSHTLGRALRVVSYRNSTSNHNLYPVRIDFIKLYLIEILHQTTTPDSQYRYKSELYLIEILHQTTTFKRSEATEAGCILSKFYIKPQRRQPLQ